MATSLVQYDEMCRAIQAAHRVDEVKDLRDKAMALEAYARQAKNVKAEQQACEIRLRAERQCGRLLKVMAKSKERDTGKGGDRKSRSHDGTVKLGDLGVSKGQSSRWQKLADVPDDMFERQVTGTNVKPTTNGIIAANAPPPKVKPVDPAALWLWGRLHDFERTHLERDPNDLLSTLTPDMLADVLRIAPLLAQWLNRLEPHDGQAEKDSASAAA